MRTTVTTIARPRVAAARTASPLEPPASRAGSRSRNSPTRSRRPNCRAASPIHEPLSSTLPAASGAADRSRSKPMRRSLIPAHRRPPTSAKVVRSTTVTATTRFVRVASASTIGWSSAATTTAAASHPSTRVERLTTQAAATTPAKMSAAMAIERPDSLNRGGRSSVEPGRPSSSFTSGSG